MDTNKCNRVNQNKIFQPKTTVSANYWAVHRSRTSFVSVRGINSDVASVSYRHTEFLRAPFWVRYIDNGPLLFLIYVNDVYSCTDDAIVKLFTDDTNLFVTGQSIDEVSAIVSICRPTLCISKLNTLNTWFLANKPTSNKHVISAIHDRSFSFGRFQIFWKMHNGPGLTYPLL